MNEQAQILAMRSELVAAGYDVRLDVGLHEIIGNEAERGRHENLTLDLVATLPSPAKGQKRSTLIVEIANRERPDGSGKARALPSDEGAVRRFDAISDYVRTRPDVDFEIRFLDVSREKSRSRRMRASDLKDREALARDLSQAAGQFAESASLPDDMRSLLLARTWAKWLRTVGQIHAGRSDRTMKSADLRTIQKELYDHQVIAMPPSEYNPIHMDLMAISEGGDFSASNVLKLEDDVRSLISWVSGRYDIDLGNRLDAGHAREGDGPRI